MADTAHVGSIAGDMVLDTSKWDKSIGKVMGDATTVKGALGGISGAAEEMMVPVLAFGAAIGESLREFITEAMHSQATLRTMDAVLGTASESAKQWSDQVAESMKIDPDSLNAGVTAISMVAKNMGLGADAALTMAQNLTQLSYDYSAFLGISQQEAQDALQGGMLGRIRALRTLKLGIKDTAIEEYALQHGMMKSGQTLTDAGKSAAIYGLIMERSKTVQGAFTRNTDTAAVAMTQLTQTIARLYDELGTLLLPTVTRYLQQGQRVVHGAIQWVNQNEELAQSYLKVAAEVAGGAAAFVAFTGLVKFVVSPVAAVTSGVISLAAAFGRLTVAALATESVMIPAMVGFTAIATAAYVVRAVWLQSSRDIQTKNKDVGDSFKKLKDDSGKSFEGMSADHRSYVTQYIDYENARLAVALRGDAAFIQGVRKAHREGASWMEAIKTGWADMKNAVNSTDTTPDGVRGYFAKLGRFAGKHLGGVTADVEAQAKEDAAAIAGVISKAWDGIADKINLPNVDEIGAKIKGVLDSLMGADMPATETGMSPVDDFGASLANMGDELDAPISKMNDLGDSVKAVNAQMGEFKTYAPGTMGKAGNTPKGKDGSPLGVGDAASTKRAGDNMTSMFDKPAKAAKGFVDQAKEAQKVIDGLGADKPAATAQGAGASETDKASAWTQFASGFGVSPMEDSTVAAPASAAYDAGGMMRDPNAEDADKAAAWDKALAPQNAMVHAGWDEEDATTAEWDRKTNVHNQMVRARQARVDAGWDESKEAPYVEPRVRHMGTTMGARNTYDQMEKGEKNTALLQRIYEELVRARQQAHGGVPLGARG